MKIDKRFLFGFAILLIAVATAVFFVYLREEELETSSNSDATEIFFGGHMYSYIDDSENIFERISIYEPDLFIYGGDSIWTTGEKYDSKLTASIETANSKGIQTLALPGNHDKKHTLFADVKPVTSIKKGSVEIISINTNVMSEKGQSCGMTDNQMTSLSDIINQEKTTKYRVVVSHHALWADPSFLPDFKPNQASTCGYGFWEKNVAPVINGEVDFVISGDGGLYQSFNHKEKDGVKYVLTGMPINKEVSGNSRDTESSQITLLRLKATDKGIEFGEVNFNSALYNSLEYSVDNTYRVQVSEEELKKLYADSPLYEPSLLWYEMIESDNALGIIQRPVSATVSINGQQSIDGLVGIRGNVGNHWRDYKKSWDIELGGDFRQIKLVIPSDRSYSDQLLVQKISETIGSPTSKISLARLYINDIDFGTYLQFEDFDKGFIETNGFNSDAVPSKNLFRDQKRVYSIIENLDSTSGDKEDKTYQQNISRVDLNTENIDRYFDRGYLAKWIATKYITADRHQNYYDNFRYIIDKTTGKYVVITWDVNIAALDDSYVPDNPLVKAFLENEKNKQLVKKELQDFVNKSSAIEKELAGIITKNEKSFINDPTRVAESEVIENSQKRKLELFRGNIEYLKKSWDLQ